MTGMTVLNWALSVVAAALIVAMLLTIADHLLMEWQIRCEKRDKRRKARLAAELEERRRESYIGLHSIDRDTQRLDVDAVKAAVAEVAA